MLPCIYILISSLFMSCATLFSKSLPSSSPSHVSPWCVMSLSSARSIPASIMCNSLFGSCCSAKVLWASGGVRSVLCSCWCIGRYVLLFPSLHHCSIYTLLNLLVRICMLCLLCTNGGCIALPSVILSTLLLWSASLLVVCPRHLVVPLLRLTTELPSAVLAIHVPSLVAPVVSLESTLQSILPMLSLEYNQHAETLARLLNSVLDWILLPMLILPAYLLLRSPICHLFTCLDLSPFLCSLLLPNQSTVVLLCPVSCRYCKIIVCCVWNCVISFLLV